MATDSIISLAMLKVHWEQSHKDYLDTFTPMVCECIKNSTHDEVLTPELQTELASYFGLQFPQAAIDKIIRRLRKNGYVILNNGVFIRVSSKLSTLNFHTVRDQILLMHETLIRHFMEYCSLKHCLELSATEAESALQDFLRRNVLIVFKERSEGTVISASPVTAKQGIFLVASFLKNLEETKSPDLEYFEKVAIGNMLANGLFLTNPTQVDKNFRGTKVYFDTSFLIFALNYAGEPRRAPRLELLELLIKSKARLCCFKHTIDEIRGILFACAKRIGAGQKDDLYGPSLEYFITNELSESDILFLSTKVEEDLAKLNILCEDTPPYDSDKYKFQIDESKLSDVLEGAIVYRRDQPLQRDIHSISAVMRLRNGQTYYSVEECPAIFVTMNSKLAEASRDFFYQGAPSEAIPPCITDYTLTNIIWLKYPIKALDLPRKRIIADCYAAIQPTQALLNLYLAEIKKLEAKGNVSPEEVFMLRYSLEARQILVDTTCGDPDAFTEGTLAEVLKIMKSLMTSDLKEQLKQQNELRQKAEIEQKLAKAEVEKINEEMARKEATRVERIFSTARKWSSRIRKALEVFFLALLSLAVIFAFPWGFQLTSLPSIIRLIVVAAFIILIIFTLLGLKSGATLDSILSRFEDGKTKWIAQKLDIK